MKPVIRDDVVAIVPTFRREGLLPMFLRAAWGGTTVPGELILLDNGQSSELLAIASDFPGTTVVRNPVNIGMKANWSKAIAVALGRGRPFVLFGQDDDLWAPSLLSTLLAVAESTQADCVFTSFVNWQPDELTAEEFLAGELRGDVWRPVLAGERDEAHSSRQAPESWLFETAAQLTGTLLRIGPMSSPEFLDAATVCPDWSGLGRWCIRGAHFQHVDLTLVAKRADAVSNSVSGLLAGAQVERRQTQQDLLRLWLAGKPDFEMLRRVARGVRIDRLWNAFASLSPIDERVRVTLAEALAERRAESRFPWTLPAQLLEPALRIQEWWGRVAANPRGWYSRH